MKVCRIELEKLLALLGVSTVLITGCELSGLKDLANGKGDGSAESAKRCVVANTTVTFVDRAGDPYRNAHLFMARGAPYESWGGALANMSAVLTDANGQITIPNADCVLYGFRQDDNFTGYSKPFLSWGTDGNPVNGIVQGGQMNRISGVINYSVVLRRVTLEEGTTSLLAGSSLSSMWGQLATPNAFGTSSSSYFRATSHYVAQAITPSANLLVCGVGFGPYSALPDSVRIHANNAGVPGVLLRQVTPVNAGLTNGQYSTSSKASGSFSELCNGSSPLALQAGTTYWVVGYYATTPSGSIAFGARINAVSTGVDALESADGSFWQVAEYGTNVTDAPHPSGAFLPGTDHIKLNVFLTE